MSKTAFFTMDVESYYDTSCIRDLGFKGADEYACASEIDAFLSLMQEIGAKATFLVTADFLPLSYEYLKKAKDLGHGIGVHAKEHISPIHQSADEFLHSLQHAKAEVEKSFGTVISYRAPCFGLDKERFDAVLKAGFTCDSSFLDFKKAVNSGTFSLDGFIKINDTVYEKDGFYEFKISKTRLFGKEIPVSGGAYLRLMPWFLVKYLLKKYLKTADSYVFYTHPFELSTLDLPIPKNLPFFKKVYINKGRKVYLKRIRKIIKLLKKENYEFLSFENFINN